MYVLDDLTTRWCACWALSMASVLIQCEVYSRTGDGAWIFSIVSDCIILYGSTIIPIHIHHWIYEAKQYYYMGKTRALRTGHRDGNGFRWTAKSHYDYWFPSSIVFLEMASLYIIFIILENSAKWINFKSNMHW